MTKLQPSLTGDNYTDRQKQAMWVTINYLETCPQCGGFQSMLAGPRGGMAENIKCKYCHMVFWLTPHKQIGAYPIRDDTPTTTKLQAPALALFSDPLCLDHKKEVQP